MLGNSVGCLCLGVVGGHTVAVYKNNDSMTHCKCIDCGGVVLCMYVASMFLMCLYYVVGMCLVHGLVGECWGSGLAEFA